MWVQPAAEGSEGWPHLVHFLLPLTADPQAGSVSACAGAWLVHQDLSVVVASCCPLLQRRHHLALLPAAARAGFPSACAGAWLAQQDLGLVCASCCPLQQRLQKGTRSATLEAPGRSWVPSGVHWVLSLQAICESDNHNIKHEETVLRMCPAAALRVKGSAQGEYACATISQCPLVCTCEWGSFPLAPAGSAGCPSSGRNSAGVEALLRCKGLTCVCQPDVLATEAQCAAVLCPASCLQRGDLAYTGLT